MQRIRIILAVSLALLALGAVIPVSSLWSHAALACDGGDGRDGGSGSGGDGK